MHPCPFHLLHLLGSSQLSLLYTASLVDAYNLRVAVHCSIAVIGKAAEASELSPRSQRHRPWNPPSQQLLKHADRFPPHADATLPQFRPAAAFPCNSSSCSWNSFSWHCILVSISS